jgi:sterol desaturase/sphingolipid hydroxylase (fatty acid hydroxylase superfamily)
MIMPRPFQHPWILLLAILLALAEFAWRWRSGRGYDGRAALTTLGVAAGQLLLRPLNVAATGFMLGLVARFAPWQAPIGDWRWWIVGFFAVEFAYYGFHRWSHRVNWLWATHAVHHSPRELVLPAAIRLGWTEFLSGGWLCFAPLVLLGLPVRMVVILLAANLAYQYLLHTEAVRRLGALEYVLNTPSHHRAHHSCETAYLDCNFGGVLIVFDRLFGTFRAEPREGGLAYGLVHPIESRNPLRIALGGWRALGARMRLARGPGSRLAVAFGRPE